MSGRYVVCSDWRSQGDTGVCSFDDRWVSVVTEVADVRDTRGGRVYRSGAWRVVIDGHLVRGKGGSVPFIGETAWMHAERLAGDIATAIRYGRELPVKLCKGVVR